MSSEVQNARSGVEVLIVDGLATASLVDPVREGEQWVESVRPRLKQVRAGETVLVVGVGSGYHLHALKETMTSMKLRGPLVAIDTCAIATEFASARFKNIDIRFVASEQGLQNFFGDERFEPLLRQTSVVLRHRPSLNRQSPESLRRVEGWILGRTPEAFSAHLKLRPEIAAGLNPARASKLAECPLLSIRDLSKTWDISSELKEDRRIFRVLEELVR